MDRSLEEIHTLHAPLIHKAREIQAQIAYQNGPDTAQIIDINQKNVQAFLESYLSKVGIPIQDEEPTGVKNNVNLDYVTAFEFIPGTLQVSLSGFDLTPVVDFIEGADKKSFQIQIDPTDPERLKHPPKQFEALTVSYAKRITFKTKGGT